MTRRQSLLLFAAQEPKPDPYVILDQSVTLDQTNLDKLRGYVWNSEERSFFQGKLTRQQSFEINLVSGAMYWRKTESEGKALSGAELEAENKRLASHLEKPWPGYNWRSERQYLELLPSVHHATYLGLENIDGRPTHVIETRPASGLRAHLLNSFRFKLWIDQADLHWRRAEITVIRDVEWLLHQLAVGRISYPYSNNIVNSGKLRAGAKSTVELQRLPEGVWTLARYLTESGTDYTNELRYFNYRRYSSESQLLTGPH
jgi:hypothetical protein